MVINHYLMTDMNVVQETFQYTLLLHRLLRVDDPIITTVVQSYDIDFDLFICSFFHLFFHENCFSVIYSETYSAKRTPINPTKYIWKPLEKFKKIFLCYPYETLWYENSTVYIWRYFKTHGKIRTNDKCKKYTNIKRWNFYFRDFFLAFLLVWPSFF